MQLEMETTQIPRQLSDNLLALLVTQCAGPREAYALLCITLWRLNFEINDEPSSIEQLCAEVSETLRTTKIGGMQ